MPRLFKLLKYPAVVAVAAAIVGLSLLLWQQRPKTDPASLFWDAMRSNLTSTGITCTVSQTSGTSTSKQAISLDLASKTRLRTMTTLQQTTGTVTTEEIDTAANTFVRYTAVRTTQKTATGMLPDFSKALNVWSKAAALAPAANLFGRTALGDCVVPLADLRSGQVTTLMSELQAGKVFTTDFTKATKTSLYGQPALKYAVTVQPEPYITFMQHVGTAYGLQTLNSVAPSSYAGRAPQKLTMYVNTKTRRLEKISYTGAEHTINFSDAGRAPAIAPPRATVTPAELQQKLQAD